MPICWPRCASSWGSERVARRRAPVFAEREAYRRRRLLDAARILPAAGLIALLMPVLWVASGGTDTGAEAVYLFGLWAGLILAARLMARPLRDTLMREAAPPPPAPPPPHPTD